MSQGHHFSVTDQRPRPVHVVLSWVFTIISAGYMLPWAIAATRGKSNTAFVFWINLLLGWTIVGWVVALVVSLRPHRSIRVP